MSQRFAPTANGGYPRWQLSGTEAVDPLSRARISLASPASGLITGEGDAGGELQLLALELPAGCEPRDMWARGNDLTAVFEPADDRGLRITAMWRVGSADGRCPGVRSWQLILSAQTSRRSTPAELTVVFRFPGPVAFGDWNRGHVDWQQGLANQPTCLRVRRDTSGTTATSLVVAIHPDDAGVLQEIPDSSGLTQIRCRLFASDLEKGVLLRSRVLVALGSAEAADPTVSGWDEAVLQQFAASAPMLSS